MFHMLGLGKGPVLAALVLPFQTATLVICALGHGGVPSHWRGFGGWGTVGAKYSLAFVFQVCGFVFVCLFFSWQYNSLNH